MVNDKINDVRKLSMFIAKQLLKKINIFMQKKKATNVLLDF
jgi:hypothetical protein